MSDAPDIREELERKSTDAVVDVLQQVDSGALSPEAGKQALRSLWTAVSGLVSRELMDTIADGIDGIDGLGSQPRIRALKKGNVMAILTLPEEGRLSSTLFLFGPGALKGKRIVKPDEGLTLAEAARKATSAAAGLIAGGFKEVKNL